MPSRIRSHITYANVVSTLCLFILLGGSAYAAVALKRNSVRGKHLARNAVSSPKVRDASLLASDFAPGHLPKGERGDPGPPGQPGTAAAYAHVNADGTLDTTRSKNVASAAKEQAGADGTGGYCLQVSVPPRLVVAASRGYAESQAVVNAVVEGDDGPTTPCSDTGQNVFLQVRGAAGTPEAGRRVDRPIDVLIE